MLCGGLPSVIKIYDEKDKKNYLASYIDDNGIHHCNMLVFLLERVEVF